MALHAKTGSGAPVAAPESTNAHYTDTDNKDHYVAVGTAAASDWRKLWLQGNDFDAQDKVLSRPELKDYAETRTTPASSAGTLTLDLVNGNVFEPTLTESVTVAFANPPAAGKSGSVTLILKQDATGGRTVTWPASVKWAGGTAPTLTTAASAVDIISFLTTDGGTTWFGFFAGADFK